MTPILTFLSEETYGYLNLDEKKESVMLEKLPKPQAHFANPEIESDFEKLFALRSEVSKKLEEMRTDKKIRGSLEASVTLSKSDLAPELWEKYKNRLAELFIVSHVDYSEDAKNLDVGLAAGDKCPRCWHIEELKEHSCGENLCNRCGPIMDELI